MAFASRFVALPGGKCRLADIATGAPEGLDRDRTEQRTGKVVKRIGALQYLLFANADRSLLVVLQGPDASGKDGLIEHVFGGLNPQGVKVTPFAEPSALEASHDFLWRVHRQAPAKGEIAVFNRSHYEGVLVERVHGLVPRATWKERYELINGFERMLAQNGTAILKFYLHISADEQLERFRRRLDDKARRWKIDEADYADRKLWDQFEEAANEMFAWTSTRRAPWYVIPSDRKWYRNFVIAKIVLKALKDFDLEIPPARVDLAAIRRKYHQAAEAG